jgi:type IV fimbrial biogenesis protein FimT
MLTRTLRRTRGSAGFTILEMMITLGVFAILVALGVPTMKTWVYNTRVRATADALQNGLRLAQSESLRRSRQVLFTLANTPPSPTSLTPATNGIYWSLNAIPAMTDGTETTLGGFIESGILSANGAQVSINGPAAICFNSLGRLVANNATGVPGATCAAGAVTYNIFQTGSDRPLNVKVAMGGQVHMCDPNIAISLNNPEGC